MLRSSLVSFFFQAEDGIRDADVTGVQTCALPIFRLAAADAGNGIRARYVTTGRQLRSALGAVRRGLEPVPESGPDHARKRQGCSAELPYELTISTETPGQSFRFFRFIRLISFQRGPPPGN